jgi:hypothetical protein
MLDVHPPHTSVHTWKDFFIHIATIVIGLLIAVGLEQTVEALHHRQERAELRETMRRESEQIVKDATGTDRAYTYRLAWLAHRADQVKATVWQHKPLEPPVVYAEPTYAYPDDPLWRSAKISGLAERLTTNEVNAYSEVEFISGKIDGFYTDFKAAQAKRLEFEKQFPTQPGGAPDYTLASPQDMRTYLTLLLAEHGAAALFLDWDRDLLGAEDAILEGNLQLPLIFASEMKFSAAPHP